MREPVTAYVGLGANLGDAQAALERAMHGISLTQGVALTARSALYRSAPVESSGPDYINAVVEVHTVLTAPELLACLQALEAAAGRERPFHNAPRTLDLDLLLYGEGCVASAALSIPHPRMWQRAFVLVPLAEIAPARVPGECLKRVLGQGVARLT